MPTPAFEAFQAEQKKAKQTTPGSIPGTAIKTGKTSAYEAFLAEKNKTTAPMKSPSETKQNAPAPSTPSPKPDVSLIKAPTSSASIRTPAPIPEKSVEASDAIAGPIFDKGLNTAKTLGNLVHDQVKELRKSQAGKDTGAGLAVADVAIETAKDAFYRKPKAIAQSGSLAGAAATTLDFGLNLATLGAVDFVTGAAPEIIGGIARGATKAVPGLSGTKAPEKVGNAATAATQFGMEKIFGDLLFEGAGGIAASGYEALTGTELSEQERNAIKSITTLGTIMAGFKAAGKAGEIRDTRIAGAKAASELVQPVAASIGLDVKVDGNGRVVPPTEAQVATAHKKALEAAAAKPGPYMRARMDAADVARQMLTDYRTLGPMAFDSEWRDTFEKGTQISQKIEEKADLAEAEGQVKEQASLVAQVLDRPATRKTRNAIKRLNEAGQFAFEQELVDMAAKNDPKLAKEAATEGYAYERIQAPEDARPAYFDALTNKITLNEDAIRKTLDRIWAGDILKVGEGRTTTIFRKAEGESFEQLKARYEKAIVDHEMAHAKTITPEDVARLRSVAGDEVKLNRIRKELEGKANEYTFQRGNDLDSRTNADIDAAVERISKGLRVRDELGAMKFADAAKEKAYLDYRKQVRRGKEAQAQDGFQERYKAERRIFDEYKVAREAQKKIAPDAKASPEVRRAVRSELRANRRGDKLETGKAKAESLALKENIKRRVGGKVKDERFANEKMNMRGKFDDASAKQRRDSEMRLLKERIVRRVERDMLVKKGEEAKAKLRQKFASKKEAQQALVNFMRETQVPNEVRGKFVSDLKNARNAEDAAGIITEIQSEYNKYSRQETAKKIKKLLDNTKVKRNKTGKNVGKLTAEAQAEIDFIRKNIGADRNELNKLIVDLEQEARAKMAKEGNFGLMLPEDVGRKIELLELGGLKDQSLTQMKRTLATIQEIRGEAMAERKAYLDRKREQISNFIASASTELIGAPKRTKAIGGDPANDANNSWAKRLYNSSAVFDDLTRDLGGVFETEGNKLASAQKKADAIVSKESAAMGERMTAAYGKDWEAEMARFANDRVDLGTMKDQNGEDVVMTPTRGEATYLYMALKEAGTREAITSPDGLAYTPEMVDRVLSIMKPGDVKLADWIQKEGYVKERARIAPVYERNNGVPLGDVNDYAGTRRYAKGETVGDETTLSLIEDMMDAAKANRLAATPGFTKSRVASNLGQLKLSRNPILDYMVYQKRVTQYVEVGDAAQRWNALLADDGIRASIKEKKGKSFLEALQYQVKKFEQGGIEGKNGEGFSGIMDAIGGNVTAALLASPKVWAGQASSFFGMQAEAFLLPGKDSDFLRGAANVKANRADVLEYSSVVSSRLAKTPSELLSKFSGEKNALQRGLAKGKEFLGKPLEFMDAQTTMRGASGIFEMQKNHYLSKGFDLEKAKRLAGKDVDNIITRTQSTRQFVGKSQLETGALKYFVQLKQQPTKIFRGNIEAGKLYRKGRITGKQYAAFLLFNNVVQGAAYAGLRAVPGFLQSKAYIAAARALGNADLTYDEEEKLKQKYSAKGLGADALMSGFTNATGFPIIGDVLSTVIQNTVFGKNYEFRPSVMNAVYDSIFNLFGGLAQGKFDEASVEGIRLVSRVAGIGDPLGAINFIMEAVQQGNKEEKAAEAKTPEGKRKAQAKRQQSEANSRAKELRIRQIRAGN